MGWHDRESGGRPVAALIEARVKQASAQYQGVRTSGKRISLEEHIEVLLDYVDWVHAYGHPLPGYPDEKEARALIDEFYEHRNGLITWSRR